MSEQPLVSIVTPSFNQAQFLEATIQSALGQDYPHIEYLVIDGGSTDGSQEIIQVYSERIAYWESQPDRGQGHAVNKGLQRAKGDILGWLNSDDLLLPQAVSQVLRAFDEHPEIDVVYGRVERIDERGLVLPTPRLPKDTVVFGKQYVIGENMVNQPGAFWRRRAMERTGWLDESLAYALDYEFWMRMALAGAKFLRLDATLAQFRLSASTKTVSQSGAMALEMLGVLEKLLDRQDLVDSLELPPGEIKKKARRTRAVLGLHAAYGAVRERRWRSAGGWLARSVMNSPRVLFERRWFDLAKASLSRRYQQAREG